MPGDRRYRWQHIGRYDLSPRWEGVAHLMPLVRFRTDVYSTASEAKTLAAIDRREMWVTK